MLCIILLTNVHIRLLSPLWYSKVLSVYFHLYPCIIFIHIRGRYPKWCSILLLLFILLYPWYPCTSWTVILYVSLWYPSLITNYTHLYPWFLSRQVHIACPQGRFTANHVGLWFEISLRMRYRASQRPTGGSDRVDGANVGRPDCWTRPALGAKFSSSTLRCRL
jgi:hypothetical protein